MTNFEAARSKCKVICNVCYVDDDALKLVLLDNAVEPDAEYSSGNVAIITKCAILVVRGWVETSRSEGGISTSVDHDAVQNNIMFWCKQCGLDVSEFVTLSTIDNGSSLW